MKHAGSRNATEEHEAALALLAELRGGAAQHLPPDESEKAAQLVEKLLELEVGSVAPEIVGTNLEGKEMRPSNIRGKAVILDSWGVWCRSCRAMYPHERSLVQDLARRGLASVGINSDESPEKARSAVGVNSLNWTSFFGGGPTSGPIATAWAVEGWPTIYVLDADGVIRGKCLRGAELEAKVRVLLVEMH